MSPQDIDAEMLARARRGAAFIDKQLGKRSWRRRVSRRTLAMGSTTHCVVGQLYGDYDEGAELLGIDPYGERAQDFGFLTDDGRYTELGDAWRIALREPAALRPKSEVSPSS